MATLTPPLAVRSTGVSSLVLGALCFDGPLETDLEPGRYLAIPVLEYGDEGLIGAQVSFRVD